MDTSPASTFDFDFNHLADDLRDRGYDTVIAELKSTGDSLAVRLAVALDHVRHIAEHDRDQLWFQLQSHTRLKGWEPIQNWLKQQRPDDTFSALTSLLEPPHPAVVLTYKMPDAPINHLSYSTDKSKIYAGSAGGEDLGGCCLLLQ